jgi:RNA polymerase sigma-70 factor (ECF subfamily)
MVCDDIIQNAFIKLFENLEKIRNKDSVQYWLFTTVRNDIYSYFRSKKIKADQFNVEDTEEVDIISNDKIEYDFEQKELRELILIELDKMSIDQREVFLLKEYGGLSYKEVADVMKIDSELVKSRLHKTRQRLIKKLLPLLI